MRRRTLAPLIAAAALHAPVVLGFDSVHDSRLWAITGVTVIDVVTGRQHADRTILIRNGRITAIGERSVLLHDPEILVVDHQGHYAIPGLWDAHVHFRGGPALIAANERWLSQYLGFGVTAVRDMGGDMPHSVLHWKALVATGDLAGPRIFTALQKLDGPGARQPGSIPIDAAEAVDAALDDLVFEGAEFVKLYELSLPAELFPVIVRKAHARGLPTAAHVPLDVPLRDLIDAGLGSVEHLYALAKASFPDDRSLAATAAGIDRSTLDYLARYARLTENVDEDYARETFRRMATHGTALVPTLAIEASLAAILDGKSSASSRAMETPMAIRATQDAEAASLASAAEQARGIFGAFRLNGLAHLAAVADEGATILAGSDTGAGNPGVYPGDSLHRELEELVKAGLSPLDALRAATLEPARWMGVDADLGSLAPGMLADIVILEANPLEDIRNTRAIAAVVQQGVYFDTKELEALKRLAAE